MADFVGLWRWPSGNQTWQWKSQPEMEVSVAGNIIELLLGDFPASHGADPRRVFFVNLEKSHSSGPIAMKSCEYSPAFGGSTCLGA